MKVGIIGAGLSGIMAAEYLKRRGIICSVFDSGNGSFNHKGVLRFKSEMVPQLLNATYEKINVGKSYLFKNQTLSVPTLQMNNIYSIKTTGGLHKRSILLCNKDSERYILTEPPYLSVPAYYNTQVISIISKGNKVEVKGIRNRSQYDIVCEEFDFLISTATLQTNLTLCGLGREVNAKGRFKPIWVREGKLEIPSTIYQTNYIIDHTNPVYRITIHAERIIVESIQKMHNCSSELEEAIHSLGIYDDDVEWDGGFSSFGGKICEVDDIIRRKAICRMTKDFNLFSFGRYAVWKPGLMLDDMIQDIEKIYKMMQMSEGERDYESNLG